MARRSQELQEWKIAHPGTIVDPELFAREILPGLQRMPLSELARTTGLTCGISPRSGGVRKSRLSSARGRHADGP